MRTLWALILSATAFGMTGCMTEATQERFTQEGARADNCRSRVTAAKVEIAKYKSQSVSSQPRKQYTNDTTALLGGALKIIGDTQIALINAAFNQGSDDMASCDDVIVAMVRADSMKVAGLNNNGATAIKWIAGLIGLGIISDNWGPANYNQGAAGDTWNVSGSRVNSKSGNVSGGGTSQVSSSGTGLGLGNTFSTGDGQSVGGVQPRTTNANGPVTDLNTGSNSGTNEPVDVQPEQLPAE